MNQYSLVSNPTIDRGATPRITREIESGQARQLLAGRQFHVCGDNVLTGMPLIDESAGGVFLTGMYATRRMQDLRQKNTTIPMIVEPRSVTSYHATPERPFDFPPDNLFHNYDLAAVLDEQRELGSDLAMTPTGQITSGDSASLKTALNEANALDRQDTLLTLPLSANWLSDEAAVRQLVRVIDRSRHPVALAFIDGTNPLASKRRMRAYRRLIRQTTGTVLAYRVDLFGFDALAGGAIASAIGAYPFARRLTPVGKGGSSSDPEDMSPHMLVGDMLRFVRSTHMRRRWFAEAPSMRCFCAICHGEALDRLHEDETDRTLGHQHNMLEIDRLYAALGHLNPAERAAAWAAMVSGAMDTYPQLETHIQAPVTIPDDLTIWAEAVT